MNAYGLRANIEAQDEALRADEVEALRRIGRELASKAQLVEPRELEGEERGAEVVDMYITPEGPGLGIAVYVAEDRRHAHIQVDDWNSHGSVNKRTRDLFTRAREELERELPGRSVEVETRDLGFWRP